eukprot:4531384-Pleurochrysis_carterae.AAC.2
MADFRHAAPPPLPAVMLVVLRRGRPRRRCWDSSWAQSRDWDQCVRLDRRSGLRRPRVWR